MHSNNLVFFAFGLFVVYTTALPSFAGIINAVLVPRKDGNDMKNTTDHAQNGTTHQGHHKNSTDVLCERMARLTKLTEISKNSTEMAEVVSKAKNATKATEEINAAPAKLATLTSNSTLVATCAIVDASKKLHSQCRKMKRLTKLSEIANNATELADITSKSRNATRTTDEIKGAAAKLATLTSNSTLVAVCSSAAAAKPQTSGSKFLEIYVWNLRIGANDIV